MQKLIKVLLLEDTPDDATLIEWELQKAGLACTVSVVTDRTEFENALMDNMPDVVLSDHSLPGFNSIEAFQLFKEHREAAGVLVPFILVTGNVSEEFAVQSFRAGIDDYILKDRLKRLPLAIESVLEKYRIENERLSYLRQVVANEALMNEAEQLAHFGSWEVDFRTGKHRWSDTTFAIYGFSPGEIEPDYPKFWSLVHPDDRARLQLQVEHTLEEENEATYEFRIIDHQGKLKYLHCKLKVQRDPEGLPVRFVGFNIDISRQKKAADALTKSEQEFRSLFDQNPDAVFSLDISGRFTNVNKGLINMVGYTREEMLGKDFRKILVKSELEKVYNHFLSALERKPQRYETTWINKYGKTFYLDVTLMAIVVDDTIIGTHCVAKDVTEKKKTENLLDQAYRTARIGGWEFDIRANKLSWTGITRELHEVPEDFEPTLESGIAFYKPGRSEETISRAVKNCIDNNVPWDLELQIITAKGAERWVRTIGQAEREHGKCVRLYGTFQDIHERKIAEEASRRAFEEKVNILETLGDAFFTVNKNWIVTYWNKMAERLLQMPRNEILGKNLWDVYSDAVVLTSYEGYHTAMLERRTIQFEDYYPALKMWFEITAYPSREGLSVYFKDITRQKNHIREIEDQNRLLNEIARIQSHEVRAPLARLIGLVNLLNNRMDRELELPEILERIGTNAQELDNQIRTIVRGTEGVYLTPESLSSES